MREIGMEDSLSSTVCKLQGYALRLGHILHPAADSVSGKRHNLHNLRTTVCISNFLQVGALIRNLKDQVAFPYRLPTKRALRRLSTGFPLY